MNTKIELIKIAKAKILASWFEFLSIDSLPSVSKKNIYKLDLGFTIGFVYIQIPYVHESVEASTLN